MKKLASILLAVSSLSLTAHAEFYTGLKVGPSFHTGELDITNKINGAGIAGLGGIFLGYDVVTSSNFYVAGEFNALWHSLDNTIVDTLKLKNNFLLGADLQLGYKLSNDVIPFISLGVAGGKYQVLNDTTELASSSDMKFEPGFGFKSIYDQLIMSVQYQYLMGSELSWLTEDDTTHSYKIRQHYFSVGFAYAM